MKNLKNLSRKELKAIKGAATCPSGNHWCPDAAVCVPIIVECYIIVTELPEGGCLSC
ncbi:MULTISPECIES: bacteriocin-like protein [Chryseobacterium]|uniref:Bacteriocin-like protein n=1 Tax=Chryseobacterium geocarposphaerae TaxID=1416776 RepID=A0ABU1LE57_9FLAO|nr:hypothetical protein [Chryseobacterium geocarposphaerae]MDR6697784.1 hypothetical protein [Chryseobacterium ginsenosidimutans]